MEIISLADARALGLSKYFTGKPCKRGHISVRLVSRARCCECLSEKSVGKNKQYYSENRDSIRQSQRDYYRRNMEHLKQKEALRKDKKREEIREKARLYYAQNSRIINARAGERTRQRVKDDPVFAITRRMRRRIRHIIVLVANGNKPISAMEMVGCKWDELKQHLERQFTKGMNWESLLAGEIEIDHIIPLAEAKTIADVVALNHFTNLRPMWSKENRQKSSRRTLLI